MVYAFLKVWANWVIRIFFRKINVTGIENIPRDKALLIASNHPNGFIEPITMACLFPKPLHFLVRGDVFENPIARFWLEQTNQIPIFRFKDGFENLRKNNKSIEISLKKLKEGESILIFVEGGTKADKRLRPLQKGLSRIAFQVLEKDETLPLDILPVGLNYFNNKKFRSESLLSVGKPLSANDYYDKYKDQVNIGVKKMTADISDGIEKNVIHLDQVGDTQLLDELLLLRKVMHKYSALPIVATDNQSLPADKAIATKINTLSEDDKALWKKKTQSIIDRYGGRQLVNRYHSNIPLIVNILLLLILAFPALLGLVTNMIPFFGAKSLADAKAKGSIFYMSIWMAGFAVFALVFYIIATIVFCLIYSWKGFLVLLGIPFFTITMLWYDRWNELWAQMSIGSRDATMRKEIQALFDELGLKL